MDVDLARTFLTISETAHFGKAAKALNVTQSTISARIKTLEEVLGQQLFVRSKMGTTLTPAGVKFRSSAEMMIRVWEHARQQVSLASDYQSSINIGGELALWQQLILKWLPWVRSSLPDVAIRTEILEPDGLAHDLIDGRIDIGLTYLPVNRPGFESEILHDEDLVLVSTGSGDLRPGDPNYVFIDWGTTFRLQHDAAFPQGTSPAITMSPSNLALRFVVAQGGAGYFPRTMARRYLDAKQAHIVNSAPHFQQRVHLVYNAGRKDEWIDTALQGLRLIASQEAKG